MTAPTVETTFRALADRQRLRILNILLDGEICVGDLVTALDAPQPTVSRHLGILRDAGLIIPCKRGLWVFHTMNEPTDDFGQAIRDAVSWGAKKDAGLASDRERALRLRLVDGCCPGSKSEETCEGKRADKR